MGTRIRTAQSVDDEQMIAGDLLKKYSLLCLPRIGSTSRPRPMRLDQCDPGDQVIFCEPFLTTVLGNISPVVDQPGRYHVFPRGGLCIEWDRTSRQDRGFLPGRYYFDDSEPVSMESAAVLKKVMSLIVGTVKKTYPKISGDRSPIFIGPHLATMITRGETDLVYYRGVPMPVSDNPLLQEQRSKNRSKQGPR